MKTTIILFLNVTAICLSAFWVISDTGYEPKITLAVSLISLVTFMRFKGFLDFKSLLIKLITKHSMPDWFMIPADRMACICYRIENRRLEFILIRDSDDKKWTIPKCMINKDLPFEQNLSTLLLEEAGIKDFEIKIKCAGTFNHLSSEDDAIQKVLYSVVRFSSIGIPQEHEKGINRNPKTFTLQQIPDLLNLGRKTLFQREINKAFKDANDMIIAEERNNA